MKIVKPHQYLYHFWYLFLYVFCDSRKGTTIQLLYLDKKRMFCLKQKEHQTVFPFPRAVNDKIKEPVSGRFVFFLPGVCVTQAALTAVSKILQMGAWEQHSQIPAQGSALQRRCCSSEKASIKKFMEITVNLKGCPLFSSGSVSLVPLPTTERLN